MSGRSCSSKSVMISTVHTTILSSVCLDFLPQQNGNFEGVVSALSPSQISILVQTRGAVQGSWVC